VDDFFDMIEKNLMSQRATQKNGMGA